jgi:hypothetical protein
MRKFLSHVFVLLVNYYTLSFLLGVLLVGFTVEHGAVPVSIGVLITLGTFLVSLVYQVTRSRWAFQSIGEKLLGSICKDSVLEQKREFKISRGPLFGLILLTLALNGNLLDGLTDHAVYTMADLLILCLIWLVQYQGFRSFIENPGIPSVVALAGAQLILGVLIQSGNERLVSSDLATVAGHYVVGLYKSLAVAWVLVGLYYRRQYHKPVD